MSSLSLLLGMAAVLLTGALNGTPAQDLSESGSANCYLISTPGTWSFRTVKGISDEALADVKSAEVLWESFGTAEKPAKGSLVKEVRYKDGRIVFRTPAKLRGGNALIAAKDAGGQIVWSWHIWICPGYVPEAGPVMDRNLGATSAVPGQTETLGLLYQWGRKDPFLNADGILSTTVAASTATWPETVVSDAEKGTIAYATAHPLTFIGQNAANGDWLYTGDSSTENKRWRDEKGLYDPCPAGWQVPQGGENGYWDRLAVKNSQGNVPSAFGAETRGMEIGGVWYPASGWRGYQSGILFYTGYYGYLWSCTPESYFAHRLYLSRLGRYYPLAPGLRAGGAAVRCIVSEKPAPAYGSAISH